MRSEYLERSYLFPSLKVSITANLNLLQQDDRHSKDEAEYLAGSKEGQKRGQSPKVPQFSWIEKAKDYSVGFHVDTSVDFFISNKLALFLEARYRLVNFTHKDGKGESVSKNMATYNYEGELYFDRDRSTGPVFFNIGALGGFQKAEINLRRLALNLGIKLNL